LRAFSGLLALMPAALIIGHHCRLGIVIRRERFRILLIAQEYHRAERIEQAWISQGHLNRVNEAIDDSLGRPLR
jgi:hypothetical protein